jgi:transcriptional regulator with XRE-family HTH domain
MATRQRGLTKSVHSDEQKAFGQLLLETRKRAGLTQWEVADRLKKPQSFVAKYEGGERRIDVVEFLVIARALGADPVRLLKTLIKRL